MQTYDFTFYDRLVVSGLILFEDIEIEGRVTFNFTPGRKSRSYYEPDDEPEIEITGIEVFGHPVEGENTKGEYRTLDHTDPLWQRIADWLEKDRFSEMCDEAEGNRIASYADYRRDQLRDDRLTGDAA